MKQSDRNGDNRVPDEELAEIARQLRGVLDAGDPVRPAPPRPRPSPRARATPAVVMLRLAGGFILPGLILVAILLLAERFSG